MKKIHLYILIVSFIFLLIYSLLQHDYFFWLTPLFFIALCYNFYLVLKFSKNKAFYFLANFILLLADIYFAIITFLLRVDWYFF